MGCKLEEIRYLGQCKVLRRCPVHGVAFVMDDSPGGGFATAHPSVEGGYRASSWGDRERSVTCHGHTHNVDVRLHVVPDSYAAGRACRCGGSH